MGLLPAGVSILVNLHPEDLGDDELYSGEAPLSRVAQRVILEITERAALDGLSDVRERIARLRRLGYRVAIDDLGAGYAGLSTFALLEPDIAKIDMSLVAATTAARDAREIVSAIVGLAGSLGLETVAEGVETAAQAAFLRRSGCSQAQGYLFARPMPAADAAWFWRARRKRNTGVVRSASTRASGAISALHS